MTSFPRSFGRYTLLASLGRGGMGEVYAASVAGGVGGIEKRCVVKTLHASSATDREYVNRFLDEARLAVRLNQRNICPVFDVGVVDGQHYLAMELVRGRDLRAIGHRAQDVGLAVDVSLVVHLVTEVLEGLHYAHELTDENGRPLLVVHRDVSPQNIMVSFDGDVKIIDFGLAASELKVEQTEANVVMGKVAYMPPEQVRGERADKSADVFATAIVLYELLTGHRYYEGVAPLMLAGAVARGDFTPTHLSTLDGALQAVLRRALAPTRSARTSTAADFADALRAWARSRDLGGDAAGLRRLMRELYGAPRDAWESMAWPAQRVTSQPPLRVVEVLSSEQAAIAGIVDPDVPAAVGDADDTDKQARAVTESATVVDDVAVAGAAAFPGPRNIESTAATEIVRTIAPRTKTTPRRGVSRIAAAIAGVALAVVGIAIVVARPTDEPATSASIATSATTAVTDAHAAPASAASSAPSSAASSAPSSATSLAPSSATSSAPPSATSSAPPSLPPSPPPSAAPTTPSASRPSPTPLKPRAPAAVDANAAALARLDAVEGAVPLEQLKAARAVCGPSMCAGVNILDEQTPARIQQCLRECRDSVRRRPAP